jgi:hypothetical protein
MGEGDTWVIGHDPELDIEPIVFAADVDALNGLINILQVGQCGHQRDELPT